MEYKKNQNKVHVQYFYKNKKIPFLNFEINPRKNTAKSLTIINYPSETQNPSPFFQKKPKNNKLENKLKYLLTRQIKNHNSTDRIVKKHLCKNCNGVQVKNAMTSYLAHYHGETCKCD